MEQTIKNDILQLSIKQEGAELCSIRAVSTGNEYMWDANPAIWGSHSPVLFPIVGCLKEDAFIYKGKQYCLPRHGFIRDNKNMKLESTTQNSLSFSLEYSEETYKIYPFQFKFTIDYSLDNNKIEVLYRVTNGGDAKMFFSLGGHPAFRCPLNTNELYSDYFLEFEHEENALAFGPMVNGLIGPKLPPVIVNGKMICLDEHTFDYGALVFKKLNSRRITLTNKKSGPVLRVDYNNFPYLGIWAKPKAQFVCIEPWLGIADSWDSDNNFETKEGLLTLGPGESIDIAYYIEIINI